MKGDDIDNARALVVSERTGPASRLWAVIGATGNEGQDGIVVVFGANGIGNPLCGTEESDIPALLDAARRVARMSGRTVRLVRYETRVDLEAFHPDGRRTRPA